MRPGAGPGSRRRNTTLAVAAVAAIVAGLIGVVFSLTFRPGTSEAQTQTSGNNAAGGGGLGGTGAQSTGKGKATGRGARPTAAPAKGNKQPGAETTTDGSGATASPVATDSTDPTATATTGGGEATNPFTPERVCGNAFQVIDSAPLRGADGVLAGRVYLLFNATTGKNCTATLKAVSVGVASPTSAYLEVQGATRITDSGNFQFFAGPVRALAAKVCVKWGGSVGDATFDSPFEHCG
jgi:serine/threonine-protein kinase